MEETSIGNSVRLLAQKTELGKSSRKPFRLSFSVIKANRKNVLLASARDTNQTIFSLLRVGHRAVIIDKVTSR